MLVYGDHKETADPRERVDRIAAQLAAASEMRPGLVRHAKLVGALIEAGQLVQGLADAGAPDAATFNRFTCDLARCVVRSWDSAFADASTLPRIPEIHSRQPVDLKLPEGFAFYAVYPEAYIAAARRLRLSARPRVIGIRSIGTTLGAMVAATLRALPPVSVRPFGDPFARRVDLSPFDLDRDAHYVIVDEGPGLSGSSFGAVADWLENNGVPLERIAFVPSHGGDLGPRASTAHRRRWHNAQRVAARFDSSFLERRFGLLEPFSIGHPWERLKFRARRNGTRLLLKFAGLGSIGEAKLDMARALHRAGFTPEPLGLVHGFLVERWCEDAQPLRNDEKPVDAIGRYIGARARLFPARDASGASTEQLTAMCRRNISLALGGDEAAAVHGSEAAPLSSRFARVRTDNKLDRDEWLRLPDGRLLKTDALDHHQGHDLIGCQDVAWDVAGAIVEFDLTKTEAHRLIGAVGRPIDPALLAFSRIAYAAFRLGQAELNSSDGHRYRRTLHLLTRSGNPQDSLVD